MIDDDNPYLPEPKLVNERKLNIRKHDFSIKVPIKYYGSNYIPTPEELKEADPEIDISQFNKDVPKDLKPHPSTIWDNLK